MAGDSIGKIFRVTTWGESHGCAIGCVIEGCPPLVQIDEHFVQARLDRRRPGMGPLSSPRKEPDKVEILSGLFAGKTTGAPVSMMIRNRDHDPSEYDLLKKVYRPGHSDFTWEKKYGIRDYRGGGRSSARLTACTVAAGALAGKVIKDLAGVEITAFTRSVGTIRSEVEIEQISASEIEKSPVRCPDESASKKMVSIVEEVKEKGDSLGGVVECVVRGVPAGLGEPLFDKLDADLARAMLAINAAKGFEVGSGFAAAQAHGSVNNDPIAPGKYGPAFATNNAGGILGGISNGMPIVFRVAFKPTPTISISQDTVDFEGKAVKLEARGRHDPCVVPRAVPVVEAMTAIVLLDHYLRHRGQVGENK